jgi:hypothetical protein
MDFVEGLPKSGSYDCILVIIDKLTKYGHFPLRHPYTALTIAHKYLDTVYRLHDLSSVVISNRDPIFTSKLWQELLRLTDTKMNMSSTHYPHTDGQTEKLNQCLESYLRCVVHVSPTKWAQWLPLGEYWYNTNFHLALGKPHLRFSMATSLGIWGSPTYSLTHLLSWLGGCSTGKRQQHFCSSNCCARNNA